MPKEGDTIYVMLPNQLALVESLTYEDKFVDEVTVPLTINLPLLVPLTITDEQLALDIDDFSRIFSGPAGRRMATAVDMATTGLYTKVWNQIGDETRLPTVDDFFDAAAILDSLGVEQTGNWTAAVNPFGGAGIRKAAKGQFNPPSDISKLYRRGIIGETADFTFLVEQNIRIHDTGNYGTGCLVKTTPVDGVAVLVLDTFADLVGTPTILKGDVFTIENVNELNEQSKQKTGRLQQFVALEKGVWDSGNADMTVNVAPTMYGDSTNPRQNMDSLPQANAAVTFDVAENTSYIVNLAFADESFYYVSANLHVPRDTDMAHVESYQGFNMRFARTWDDVYARYRNRLDMLIGVDCLRGGLAVRVKSETTVSGVTQQIRHAALLSKLRKGDLGPVGSKDLEEASQTVKTKKG
jgi:hypothetical protein